MGQAGIREGKLGPQRESELTCNHLQAYNFDEAGDLKEKLPVFQNPKNAPGCRAGEGHRGGQT